MGLSVLLDLFQMLFDRTDAPHVVSDLEVNKSKQITALDHIMKIKVHQFNQLVIFIVFESFKVDVED